LQAGRASLSSTAAAWQPHWQDSPAQGVQAHWSFILVFVGFIEVLSGWSGSTDLGCPMSALCSPAAGQD
jgi:hypothetical protein